MATIADGTAVNSVQNVRTCCSTRFKRASTLFQVRIISGFSSALSLCSFSCAPSPFATIPLSNAFPNLDYSLSRPQTENEWSYISDDAKDLIQHLLVKDASQRYTADMVLKHRWVAQGGSFTPLETPSIMRKNNSYKDLAACVGGANAIKRLVLYQQNLSSDFKSSLEQCVGSYKDNSSSLVLTGDSSPTFDLHFTSDEDAFLSDLDQQVAESIVHQPCPPALDHLQPEQQQQQPNDQPPQQLPANVSGARKVEMKSVKWVDLQEQDEEEFGDETVGTPARPTAAAAAGNDKKLAVDTPLKSALKSSVDRSKQPENGGRPPARMAEMKKKRKKTIQQANRKNGSTTSSNTSSSDESSDYNNNAIDEGEDADIDEMDNDDSAATGGPPVNRPALVAHHHQQTNRTNQLQKMLECIENRKRLSSASCYVISNVKNKQTASLNFCPNLKSMLII